MYATITREALISTLQTAMLGNASVKRHHMPILACVRLMATTGSLTVSATDLEMAVTTTSAADVTTRGIMCADAKALLAAVRGMPRKARVTLATTDAGYEAGQPIVKLAVRCDGLTTTLDTWDVDDYPLLPTMPDNGAVAVLPAADVARMITETAPHAATDEARPVFTGIYTQVHDDHVTMATADGFRLAVATTPLQSAPWANATPPHGIGMIVPARCMVALAKIVGKGDGPVVVDCGNPNKEPDRATFTYGDTTMTTRLISGTYVTYQQIIPAGHAATVTAATTELAAALDTFKRAAKGIGNDVLCVHEAEGGLVLSMAGEGSMGAFVRATVTTTTAEPMAAFAVNPAMLASAVASMGRVDSVALGTPDQACKPMTITAVGRDDVRIVVMPMSVSSNGIDHARDTARGITRNKYGLPSAPVADVAGHAAVTATPDATGDDGWENVTATPDEAPAAVAAVPADASPDETAAEVDNPSYPHAQAARDAAIARALQIDGDGRTYVALDVYVSPRQRPHDNVSVTATLPTGQIGGVGARERWRALEGTRSWAIQELGCDVRLTVYDETCACDDATTAAYQAGVDRLASAGIAPWAPVQVWPDANIWYKVRGDDDSERHAWDDDVDLGDTDDSRARVTRDATWENDAIWEQYAACYAGTLDALPAATCDHDDDDARPAEEIPTMTTPATPLTTDAVLEVVMSMDETTVTHCAYAARAASERGHIVDCAWQQDGQVYWCQCMQCHGPVVVLDGAVHALPTSCQAATGDDGDAVDGPPRPQEHATTPDDAVGHDDGGDAPVATCTAAATIPTVTADPYGDVAATVAIPTGVDLPQYVGDDTSDEYRPRERGPVRSIGAAEAARMLRAALSAVWPRVAFRVRGHRGSSINVDWIDGPTTKQVEYVTNRYQGKGVMDMSDYVPYVDRFYQGERVHFTAGYVFARRHHSVALAQQVADDVARDWGYAPITVTASAYDGDADWSAACNVRRGDAYEPQDFRDHIYAALAATSASVTVALPPTDDDDHGARDSAPQATVDAYWDHAATQRLRDDDDARSDEYRAIYEANMATLHQDAAAALLGYEVERAETEVIPGHMAYKLHGRRVSYTLMRNVNHPHILFALNSHGNVCGIKGNYTFSDESGAIRPVNRL